MKPERSRKKQMNIYLDVSIIEEFEKVANAEHMEASRFAALLVSKFSDLKQGNAIAALASIPKELFKLRPGRTATPSSASDTRQVGASLEHAV